MNDKKQGDIERKDISSHRPSVVRFVDNNGMKMIRRENGDITKECCLVCRFENFHDYFSQPVDVCFLCDKDGSMKHI